MIPITGFLSPAEPLRSNRPLTRTRQAETWICLSATWWLGSLIAWLGELASTPSLSVNPNAVFGTGLFIIAVSAALRSPAITALRPTNPLLDRSVWLLGLSANINWLGMLTLRSGTMFPVVLVGLIGFAIEVWLFQIARNSGRLNEFTRNPHEDPPPTLSTFHDPSSAESTNNLAELKDKDTFAESSLRVSRTTEDGVDEQGNRYMSGEIRTQWNPDQKTQTVVVGFTPAFRLEPDVEFEMDSSEYSVRLVHCSQAGMRLNVKRLASSRAESSEANGTTLVWYAAERLVENETIGTEKNRGSSTSATTNLP